MGEWENNSLSHSQLPHFPFPPFPVSPIPRFTHSPMRGRPPNVPQKQACCPKKVTCRNEQRVWRPKSKSLKDKQLRRFFVPRTKCHNPVQDLLPS